MRRLNFFALERVVQDRVVAATRGGYSPPLLAASPLPLRLAGWVVACAGAGLLCLLLLPWLGWGVLGSAFGLHAVWTLGLYIPAALGLGFLGLHLAARIHDRARAPMAAGVYAFPGTVLQADGSELCAHALAELRDAQAQGGLVTLRYASTTLRMHLPDEGAAQALVAALLEAQQLAAQGKLAPESSDPLVAPKFASPVGPVGGHRRTASFWQGAGLVLGLVCAAVAGVALWWGRNYQSDEAMYARARAADSVAAYQAYVASGSRHVPEVRALDLPRVTGSAGVSLDARIAEAKRNADAAALRAMLPAGVGVDALAGPPAHCMATGAHADPCAPYLVVAALNEVANQRIAARLVAGPKADAAELGAWAQVLRRATLTGGALRVQTTHARVDGTALARSDKYLAHSTLYMGEVSRLSKHFDESDEVERDARDAAALVAELSAAFPATELQVLGGSPSPGDAGLLEVRRSSTWSGRVFSSKSPRGVFLGMTYQFEIKLQAVGGAVAPFARKVSQMVGVESRWMAGESLPASDVNAKSIADLVYFTQSQLAAQKARAVFLAPVGRHSTE